MLTGTKSWLNQTITRYPATGSNNYGQPTYGSTNTIACQIIQRNVITTSKDGSDVMSSTQILIDGAETIGDNDKIVLPDGTTYPYIIGIKSVPNPRTGSAYFKMIYS
jgi:hypothetical protein